MNFTMTFGRYKGKPICDLPYSYLNWLVSADNTTARQCRAKRTKDYEAAKLELARRKPTKKKDNTVKDRIITARRNMFRYFQAEHCLSDSDQQVTTLVRVPKSMVDGRAITGRLVLVEAKQVVATLLNEVMVDDVDNLHCPRVMSWVDTEAYERDTLELSKLVDEAIEAAEVAKRIRDRADSDMFLAKALSGFAEKGSSLDSLVIKIKQVGDD